MEAGEKETSVEQKKVCRLNIVVVSFNALNFLRPKCYLSETRLDCAAQRKKSLEKEANSADNFYVPFCQKKNATWVSLRNKFVIFIRNHKSEMTFQFVRRSSVHK